MTAAQGAGATPPPRPTSRLAATALGLGIIGLVLPSVICGVLALRRIRRDGLGGRGLAIAGLVLSGLWTAIIGVGIVLAVTGGVDRDGSGRITASGSVSVFDVRDGDCLNGVREAEQLSVDAVPCSEPHAAEAYAVFLLDGDAWPGLDRVQGEAEQGCGRRVPTGDGPEFEVFYYHPTEQTWEARDDREVVCVAEFPRKRRGSLYLSGG